VIRTVVADDDAAFRGALVDVLGADPRFLVVEAVSTGERIVDVARKAAAHVVLLDVRMPEGGTLAARSIRQATQDGSLHDVVVVALSAQASTHAVVSMLREGALGYLVKGRIGSELPDLVARCAAGELVLAVPHADEALRQLARVDS
jgi:DNA-binding NarL/FixJ family response regulator